MNIQAISHQTFRSLKIRNYRLYFIGQAISLCGTWMQSIAQAWLVLRITGSGTQLGIVLGLQFLPYLVFGAWGGVIADRFDKRRLIVLTQAASGVLALILGLLVITGLVQIWMVYVLAACWGLVNVMDSPARHAFVHDIVGRENLANAVTLNATEANLARAIGPAIAGALIAGLGIAFCFFINAASYVAVLIVLKLMRDDEIAPAERIGSMRGQFAEGLRYAGSVPLILTPLIMMAIIGTFSYEFSAILPLFAKFTFHGEAGTYAVLTSAIGVGSVLGGIVTASRKEAQARILVYSALFFGLSLLITALMPTVVSAAVILVLVGIFSINFISLGNSILQLTSKPEMRGRMLSLWFMAFLGSTPIGGPIIGWIGDHLGPRFGIVVGGAAAVLAAGIGALILFRKPRGKRLNI